MKKIYLTALLCLSFVLMFSMQSHAQAIKEIHADHTFKVTFSKEVKLEGADTYISLIDSTTEDTHIPFTISYGATKKILLIKPSTPLIASKTYVIAVKTGMPSITGKTLKTTVYQKFEVKEAPKTLAPINSALQTHLQPYKKSENNNILVYGGENVSQATVDGLANTFNASIQNYVTRFFPEIAKSTKKPTVVVLGNEADKQTYANAGGYVSNTAVGWISHKDNIIVMTKDTINTNLITHEYIHWMYSNVYNVQVPSWINEATAFLYAFSYLENKEKVLDLSIAKAYIQNVYDQPIVEGNLKTAYSQESLAAITMMLDEYGLYSLHSLLLDAQKSSFEQAWKQHYGVSYDETIAYTYKARTAYENHIKEQGYDLAGLQAYNAAHANEKPIPELAFDIQLQLFGKYTLVETPLYRIYASPSVSSATLTAVKSYTDSITPLYTSQLTSRPLLILLSPSEAAQLAEKNGKEAITGYGKLKSSLVLNITTPANLTTSKKEFIEKCLTNYHMK